jgi:predicted nucleotidyltransferase
MIPLRQARTVSPETRTLLLECKRLIQQSLPDAIVLLYGSVARGTAGPESDYDLAVLTGSRLTTTDEDRIRDALYDLELEHEVVISVLFFNRAQWDTPLHQAMPLHREVEREGVML